MKKESSNVANIFDFIENKQKIYDENDEISLISFLQECDRYYYIEGSEPKIIDSEYDRLKDIAQYKWPTNDYFSNDNIGMAVSGTKIQHPYILGSLNKYKVDNILDWLLTIDINSTIYCLPKFDGISIYAEYIDGKLIRASTRGNGTEGTDITQKIIYCAPTINLQGSYSLRGEIVLPFERYKELNLSNRRNGASGIIGKKDIIPELLSNIYVVYYEIISPEIELSKQLDILQEINTFLHPELTLGNFSKLINRDLQKSPEQLIELLNVTKNIFAPIVDLDGLVLIHTSDADTYKRENVYKPKNKISFKHTSESAHATVKFVEWQTSRNGRVIPVVNFCEPYPLLGGANIRKATGYNAAFILKNKITEGTIVEVCRSGDVVPKILNVIN